MVDIEKIVDNEKMNIISTFLETLSRCTQKK